MNNDVIALGAEIGLGAVIIPWTVWVSVAIFNLRQEQAVMRMEMGLMKDIKAWLSKNGGANK